MANPIPVTVIGGYLGSGKTTFINKALQNWGLDERIVVLVNEFGDVGIDGELLSSLLDAEHRRYINSSTAWRAVIGLEGLWGGWDWRLSGLVSENDVEKDFLNEVYVIPFLN